MNLLSGAGGPGGFGLNETPKAETLLVLSFLLFAFWGGFKRKPKGKPPCFGGVSLFETNPGVEAELDCF